MSSAIMSLLISHILTFVESELMKQEPAIIAALTQDVQSLISKLESLISDKSPQIAAITNPVLNEFSSGTVSALEAAGEAVANGG